MPRYATGLSLLPNSDPSDGILNIGYFERSGRIRGIFQYLEVLRGNHRANAEWKECVGSEVHISVPEHARTASVQYDGDWGGSLPLSIRVLPKRLTLVV
ncbi:MAG: hypothetical protein MUC83_11660 [Pirellula sp.]|nr:hypothetical protein [Pirellula sp.]